MLRRLTTSFLSILLLIFSGCSSREMSWTRGPASVGGACNRQSLGETTLDNSPLVQFNSKRTDAINKLLITQIEKLKSKATSDASLKSRMDLLQKQAQSISPAEIRISDEPLEVSWKLGRALDSYMKDMALDEQAHALSDKEQEKLKYVRESVKPHLSEVQYWMPDFCKKLNGEESTDTFKGI